MPLCNQFPVPSLICFPLLKTSLSVVEIHTNDLHSKYSLVLSSLAQSNVLKNFKFFVMCIKNPVLFIANKYFIVNFTICWSTYLLMDQFSSAPLLSRVRLFATPWTAARQASLFITNSQSLLRLMSIRSVMPSNHLNLCHPLLLPPSIFPSIRVFSNESALCIRWPKYWSCWTAEINITL